MNLDDGFTSYSFNAALVFPENGEELKNRFDEAGVKYDYVFFPDSDHALIHNFGKRIVYAGIVIDYCEEYFK
jgi:dipeptidyl aminopeptidase/acylaminoacyl peptidase